MNQWQPWMERWRDLFEEQLTLEKLPEPDLPLALQHRFSYAMLHCRGIRFLAALDEEHDTPANYQRYQQQLEYLLGMPVVFFLTKIVSYEYGRLVRARVSFITRSGYVYIPLFFANVAPVKVFSALSPTKRELLSPVAQVLLLRQLLFHDLHGCSMRSIADKLKPYVAMSISNAKDELESKGLCLYTGAVTRGQLEFPKDDAELWEQALPFLKNPIQKRRYIRTEASLEHLPLAGESALSAQSLLSPPLLPTYAIGKTDIRDFLASPSIEEVDEVYANAVIEHWRYSPSMLMRPEARSVDQLSLYLSLRDSADDRVRQELHKLILP